MLSSLDGYLITALHMLSIVVARVYGFVSLSEGDVIATVWLFYWAERRPSSVLESPSAQSRGAVCTDVILKINKSSHGTPLHKH